MTVWYLKLTSKHASNYREDEESSGTDIIENGIMRNDRLENNRSDDDMPHSELRNSRLYITTVKSLKVG